MLDIKFYKTSWFFKQKKLLAWELVFKEWDLNENLYIIVSWKVSIEKYTTTEKTETKELAILKEMDFFWEASMNADTKKEASVKVLEEAELLYINWNEWLKNFLEKYPIEWFELLKFVIFATNSRLHKANRLVTASYEIVKSIISIETINYKNIFLIIDKIKLITGYDYILYFELNPVLKNFLVLKYDTRDKWKMKDLVIERWQMTTLQELDEIVLKDNNFVQKLNIWKLDLWFMIFWKKTGFTDEDKKIIITISSSLTWLLKQKEINKEEVNKKYMKNF